MTTVDAALASARAAFKAAGAASPALDARLLLAAAADVDMAGLIARGNEELPLLAASTFASHISRRIAGEPVARILGCKEFWGLSFALCAATLVPRPETETVVEAVLEEAGRFRADLAICDLGTGSGAILVALLTELPQAQGVGVDICTKAVDAARGNADRLGVGGRARFLAGDFAVVPVGRFDVVVSNPPYIESAVIAGLPCEVRDFDPHGALDGGVDGLAAYRVIVARAPALLEPGGLLALEVGQGQAGAVAALCVGAGLDGVAVRPDLAGIGRVVTGFAAPVTSRPAAKIPLGISGISG